MLAGWRAGESRDLHLEMTRLTLEIVLKILFQTELSDHARGIGPILDRMLVVDGRLVAAPAAVRYLVALRRLEALIYRQIGERKTGRGTGDLLSILLAARDEDGNAMSDRQVRDEVMTFIGAGYETTSLALCYALHLLSQNPEAEMRLAAEITEVLQGRPPEAADVPRLAYTEKVIKESMRLLPPAWAMSRDAVEPVEIGGYRLPAGTCFFLNLWSIHHDPRFYDSPEAFEPERWTADFERQLPKFAYFPFGGGQRMCIGAGFAKLEAALVLASVVQKFRVSADSGWKLQLEPAVLLRPRGGVLLNMRPR